MDLAKKYYKPCEIYFKRCEITEKENFFKSQISFYFAVDAWSKVLGKLISQTNDILTRKVLIDNLLDENGQVPHVVSYENYLKSFKIPYKLKNSGCVEKFIKNLNKNTTVEYLGMIEYCFAIHCKHFINVLKKRNLFKTQTHFLEHSELDLKHAKSLFDCSKEEDLIKESRIRIANRDFNALFEELTTIFSLELPKFGKSFEDCNPEKIIVSKFNCKTSLCIGSGGNIAKELDSLGIKVVVIDNNNAQLKYIKQNKYILGAYDEQFILAKEFGFQNVFCPDRLISIFGNQPMTTNEDFWKIAENLSKTQFDFNDTPLSTNVKYICKDIIQLIKYETVYFDFIYMSNVLDWKSFISEKFLKQLSKSCKYFSLRRLKTDSLHLDTFFGGNYFELINDPELKDPNYQFYLYKSKIK